MNRLTIETFIAAAEDLELSQYRILASLQKYTELLHHSKLYPSLSELIETSRVIDELLNQRKELQFLNPEHEVVLSIARMDDDGNQTEYSNEDIQKVFDMILWADPKIKEAVEEGKAIYDFVDDNMNVEEFGIVPIYQNEGYFIIPNKEESKFYIYRYAMNLLSNYNEPLRTFRASLVESSEMKEFEILETENIKLSLTKKFPELPNPPLFNIDVEIDFPFFETILPVAKRKLVRKLAA